MLKGQKRHRHAAADGVKAMYAGTLVGRQKEIGKLLLHISNRQSLHIYGPEGTGKSALLNWAYDNWHTIDHSLIPIYCRSSRTLRQILLYIAGFLLDHFKHLESIDKFKKVKEIEYPSDIKKLSIRHLRNLIFAYIPQDNFCVMLDHLEYVTPKINGFLTTLYEKAFVISASRESWELADYEFKGRLDYCLYLTQKLRVENLQKKESLVFMKQLCEDQCMTDRGRIFGDVHRITKGNPMMIKRIFEKSQHAEYYKKGGVNLDLILIDCRMDEVELNKKGPA